MVCASNRTIRKTAILLLILLYACSGFERAEREKVRRLNCKTDPIDRLHNERFYTLHPPLPQAREPYPWEGNLHVPKITKEFFRCKGSSLNPPLVDERFPDQVFEDCGGARRHGLPILRNQESVYPILIELLNYVQKKTGKRVIITSGHRCPSHNTYCDPSKENLVSKHQIGAAVDFYVQGMEERPQEIVGVLMSYFEEKAISSKDKKKGTFRRISSKHLATDPWQNEEVLIRLYQKDEGRDGDNRHPHPYICLQAEYDPRQKEKIAYTWKKAHLGYPRF